MTALLSRPYSAVASERRVAKQQADRAPTLPTKHKSLIAPVKAKKAKAAFVPRVKHHGEAHAYTNTWTHGTTYKTGDGEVTAHARPGSLHAYTLPSRGYAT